MDFLNLIKTGEGIEGKMVLKEIWALGFFHLTNVANKCGYFWERLAEKRDKRQTNINSLILDNKTFRGNKEGKKYSNP